MSKARLITVLSVTMLILAIVAAIFNTIDNGRITGRTVAGLLFVVSMALALRSVSASIDRGRNRQDGPNAS